MSFESNAVETRLTKVIPTQLRLQSKTNKVKNVKSSIQTKYILKMLEGRQILFFDFCTSKLGHTSDVTL